MYKLFVPLVGLAIFVMVIVVSVAFPLHASDVYDKPSKPKQGLELLYTDNSGAHYMDENFDEVLVPVFYDGEGNVIPTHIVNLYVKSHFVIMKKSETDSIKKYFYFY